MYRTLQKILALVLLLIPWACSDDGGDRLILFQGGRDMPPADPCEGHISSISLSPAPATDSTTLTFRLREEGGATVTLFSPQGKAMTRDSLPPARQHRHVMCLKGLWPGTYLIKIDAGPAGCRYSAKKLSIIR